MKEKQTEAERQTNSWCQDLNIDDMWRHIRVWWEEARQKYRGGGRYIEEEADIQRRRQIYRGGRYTEEEADN